MPGARRSISASSRGTTRTTRTCPDAQAGNGRGSSGAASGWNDRPSRWGSGSTPSGSSSRGRVDVVAEPEFEHQEGPELVGVVAQAPDVLVDQGGDGLGAEQAAT